MEYEIRYRPSYSMLVVKLNQGETITAEAGAMTYMTPNIQMKTRARAGVLDTIKLGVLGGQSFFVNDYTAVGGPGEIALASAPLGDIEKLTLDGRGYIIQRSSYVASDPTVELDIKWQGFTKGIFGQGLFMIKTSGRGNLFINTFGAIDRHELSAGESLIVDNFHLVAFSDTCSYEVRRMGRLKELALSGEGLVVEVRGPGEVLIQTKNISEFANWIWRLLEPKVRATMGAR
ncbi:TIGR00266 family protein [Candidatus Korarchaeum cryptofilum]|uniref:TIGR00266 family protein n=1 Tax=Candidatus Korarchaeum cryptofilum TaxID=498846 RepID=A0A3R9QXC8_9CREN|nr:TIGR00266 family protein [Candidatus Korarchaeum cryptofilum]RSN67045.1 TIGR00266 family protein [Candidatus Korarchaeum cryptofilum]